MKVFTASNGILFTIAEDGVLKWEGGYDHHRVTAAVREYFQQERDQELGRWRDPENPDYVVYPGTGTAVTVVCETNGFSTVKFRGDVTGKTTQLGSPLVAFHYFKAHPKPEPWHDAQPGEVWLLSSEGEEHAWIAQKSEYDYLVFCRYLPRTKTAYTQLISDSNITAGRRIWPEAAVGTTSERV